MRASSIGFGCIGTVNVPMSGGDDHVDGFDRIAGVSPAVETALEGANALDAEAAKVERDFGAGFFAGAGAVEDDVAVAGNEVVALFQFVGAQAESVGQGEGVGEDVEGVAKIYDERSGQVVAIGVSEHGLKLGGFQAEAAKFTEKADAADVAGYQDRGNHKEDEADAITRDDRKPSGAALNDIAEEAAAKEPGTGPDKGAGEVIGCEGAIAEAGLASQRRGHGAEAGDEFGVEHSDAATAAQAALGAGDAGGGLEGKLAEDVDDAGAVAAAKEEPERVRQQAGEQDDGKNESDVEPVRRAHGAGGKEYRGTGDGDAALFDEDPAEEDGIGVVNESSQ